jgi:hypothetical protein
MYRCPILSFGIILETVYNQFGFKDGRTLSEGGHGYGSGFYNLGDGRETGD